MTSQSKVLLLILILGMRAASNLNLIEMFPLDRAEDAYNHMISGKVRFRSVIKV